MVASSSRELGLQLLLVHWSEAESPWGVWNLHHPQFSRDLWCPLAHGLSNVAASCGQRSPSRGFWCFFLSSDLEWDCHLESQMSSFWLDRMSSCGQVWAAFFPFSPPRRGQAPSLGRSKNPHPSLGQVTVHQFPCFLGTPPSLSLTVLSRPSFQARYSVKNTHYYVCVCMRMSMFYFRNVK